MRRLHISILERCFQFGLLWVILVIIFEIVLEVAYGRNITYVVLTTRYILLGLIYGAIIIFSPLVALGLPNAQKGAKPTDKPYDNLDIKRIRYVFPASIRFISRYYHLQYTRDDNKEPYKDKYTTSYQPSLFHIIEPFFNIFNHIIKRLPTKCKQN
ncbi:hypothetical protein ACFLUY_02570 [Chloroflexota bacterium]